MGNMVFSEISLGSLCKAIAAETPGIQSITFDEYATDIESLFNVAVDYEVQYVADGGWYPASATFGLMFIKHCCDWQADSHLFDPELQEIVKDGDWSGVRDSATCFQVLYFARRFERFMKARQLQMCYVD